MSIITFAIAIAIVADEIVTNKYIHNIPRIIWNRWNDMSEFSGDKISDKISRILSECDKSVNILCRS